MAEAHRRIRRRLTVEVIAAKPGFEAKAGKETLPARRNRGQRKDRKEALRRIRRLLDMASRETPDRATHYLREIVSLETEAPPGWRDTVAIAPHLVPLLRQLELECIRRLLAMATGQTPDRAKVLLREIVTLAESGAAPPGWRNMVATESPQHVDLLDYVIKYDEYDEPREPVRSGHNRGLTQEESKLITDYQPLVRSLAVRRASVINNLAGGTALDHELLAHLENIGMEVLIERAPQWDRARGWTFGAFVRARVAGAMDNYLSRNRIRTERLGDDAIDKYLTGKQIGLRAARSPDDPREQEKWENLKWEDLKPTKGKRTSTRRRKGKSYVETAPKRQRARLIKANPDAFAPKLAEALAQLSPNQRAVYEGRVIADPPLLVSELARRLKVSPPRITHLEKRACERMKELLCGI
jgi:RNA polymerase sigma factor (sigma-70 family)